MYPHSVIGFGFAIDGFKLLFAHLEAKAFKTKLCVHTSCGQIQELSAQVGFSEPGKLERLFIKCCSLLWTDRACPQMLLHASLICVQKTTAPCLQTWHPRSEPSARKLSPDRGKKGCSKLAPEQTKRVLGAQKRGQAFCMSLIAGPQVGGPSFGSRFRPQKWDRKMQKKGPAFCLRASVVARSLA